MKTKSIAKSGVIAAVATLMLAGASFGTIKQILPATPVLAQSVINGAPAAGFADLVEKVMPGVISVEVEFQPASLDEEEMPSAQELPFDSPFREFFEQFKGNKRFAPREQPRGRGQGSGFIISKDGYAVTNNHVVNGASQVTVKLNDGTSLKADVIGTDPKTDLALLKINSDREFAFVKFARNEARVGDWVVAVGNPFGLGGTVTTGVVSARGRNIGSGPYDDYLQIDASINRGNSGGPAFNLNGEVIGVNTAIFSPSGGSVGIGFAIPAGLTQSVINDLKDDGAVTRGWLGVQIQAVTDEIAESLGLRQVKGAIVAEVTAGSPAERGGLKTGDTILSIDGKQVEDPRDLALKVSRINPGQKSEITVWREGKEKSLNLEIGHMPGQKSKSASGGKTTPDNDILAETGMKIKVNEDGDGVLIVGVRPGSQADEAGLRKGDVITEAAGIAVDHPSDLTEAMRTAAKNGKSRALLLVKTGERQRFVALASGKS